jgi:hypothetical protein
VKISPILLVLGALLCVAPTVIAQQSRGTSETVIIQIDDYLITRANLNKEKDRLLRKDPRLGESDCEIIAIRTLVERALILQGAAKLKIPLEQYRAMADEVAVIEIERHGSRDAFLLENKKKFGVLDIKGFSEYTYHRLVYLETMRIVVGRRETDGKGFRVILEPSPAELRRAYKENQAFRIAPAVLKWSYLKFYKKSNGDQTPEKIVEDALASLENGSISTQELVDLADEVLPNVGQPEDTVAWILDFVSSGASAGEHRIGPQSESAMSVVVITENSPAREYTFYEAQSIITKRLTDKRMEKVIGNFYAETAAVVDIWVTDDVPGLKNFVSQVIGRHIPANNSEEL